MRTLDVLKRPNWEIVKGGYWLNARDLGISGEWEDKWDCFIGILKHDGITLTPTKDAFVWSWNKKNRVLIATVAYNFLIRNGKQLKHNWWYKGLWKWNISTKLKCFGG